MFSTDLDNPSGRTGGSFRSRAAEKGQSSLEVCDGHIMMTGLADNFHCPRVTVVGTTMWQRWRQKLEKPEGVAGKKRDKGQSTPSAPSAAMYSFGCAQPWVYTVNSVVVLVERSGSIATTNIASAVIDDDYLFHSS
jgi:hypothetical protein